MALVGPRFKCKAIGDSLILYLNNKQSVLDLNLVYLGWHPGVPDSSSSSYPCNPYTMLPRLTLRFQDVLLTGMVGAGSREHLNATCSMFYMRRQNPGESHQELLMADWEAIANPFPEDKLTPYTLSGAIPGFSLEKCWGGGITIHSDLRHEFDDPSLRISVAQIEFKIEGKMVQYDE
jgi:hypothetical protein